MSFRGGCFYKHKLHKYLPDGEVCLPQSQCMVQTTSQRATEIREGKVSYISFPVLCPQNSCLPTALENMGLKWLCQKMGVELLIGPLLLCGERPSAAGVGWVGGWVDGWNKSWERIQALRRKKMSTASHLLYAVRWLFILTEKPDYCHWTLQPD